MLNRWIRYAGYTCCIIAVSLNIFLIVKGLKEKQWSQTSCINNSVMEWRHSYWHDLGHYCVTSEDLTNMAERNKRKLERKNDKKRSLK